MTTTTTAAATFEKTQRKRAALRDQSDTLREILAEHLGRVVNSNLADAEGRETYTPAKRKQDRAKRADIEADLADTDDAIKAVENRLPTLQREAALESMRPIEAAIKAAVKAEVAAYRTEINAFAKLLTINRDCSDAIDAVEELRDEWRTAALAAGLTPGDVPPHQVDHTSRRKFWAELRFSSGLYPNAERHLNESLIEECANVAPDTYEYSSNFDPS